ncbi:YfhO family protein [Lacticaseibacillus thailandensis]|uniref:YfhO family protein n=1 Tax=Lacticaseibacillus thailandensis TaxID=381741 RepID=UPI0034E26BE2
MFLFFWIIRALLCKMKSIAITVICFAFSSVLVLLISAVVTLPGFLGSSQVRKSAIFHFWPVYSFPNLISQLFSESQVFNTNLHVPIIYVGLLVLVVFFYFFSCNQASGLSIGLWQGQC